jgi:CMP-N-acetylneuraminic acid synthetase
MKVRFIIPARGGSKRLIRKNMADLCGKPLISYAIDACMRSRYYDGSNLFVSTEDAEIKKVSLRLGASIIDRPHRLSKDDVWTQDVLKHAVKMLEAEHFDIVVRIQANSPQVTCDKIDECIKKLISFDLWEVFTVDEKGVEDSAIHVLRKKCVYQEALSVFKGVVFADYTDIHTADDLEIVKNKMLNGKQ